MPKPLLNYTTMVEVQKTVAEITKILVNHNASAIATEYELGQPTSISFKIRSPHGFDTYCLPVRIDRAWAVLKAQRAAGKIAPRYATREHAARVGWRITKDWIEAQLALVATRMVDLDEIMLPFLIQGGQSVYEYVQDSRKALTGPK